MCVDIAWVCVLHCWECSGVWVVCVGVRVSMRVICCAVWLMTPGVSEHRRSALSGYSELTYCEWIIVDTKPRVSSQSFAYSLTCTPASKLLEYFPVCWGRSVQVQGHGLCVYSFSALCNQFSKAKMYSHAINLCNLVIQVLVFRQNTDTKKEVQHQDPGNLLLGMEQNSYLDISRWAVVFL